MGIHDINEQLNPINGYPHDIQKGWIYVRILDQGLVMYNEAFH